MDIHFEPVTAETRALVEALSPLPGQDGFVESVSQCMSEADGRKSWRPVGIYGGDMLVGFAMYGFFWEYLPLGRVWFDRLLIDGRAQGKGYGKAAVSGLLARLRKEYRRKKVYLSVYDTNPAAIGLYERTGFHFTGELDEHGEKVMVYRF